MIGQFKSYRKLQDELAEVKMELAALKLRYDLNCCKAELKRYVSKDTADTFKSTPQCHLCVHRGVCIYRRAQRTIEPMHIKYPDLTEGNNCKDFIAILNFI